MQAKVKIVGALCAGLILGGGSMALGQTATQTLPQTVYACQNLATGAMSLYRQNPDTLCNTAPVRSNNNQPAFELVTMDLKGPQGAKGDQGIQGVKGDQGIQGVKGDKGDQGIQGVQGERGLVGPAGRDGVDGKDGAPGLNGTAGKDGVDGKDGAPGLNGAAGPAGERGPQGERGPAGAPGLAGLKGDKGDKGDTGATGPQGPVGPMGPMGPAGPGLSQSKFYLRTARGQSATASCSPGDVAISGSSYKRGVATRTRAIVVNGVPVAWRGSGMVSVVCLDL